VITEVAAVHGNGHIAHANIDVLIGAVLAEWAAFVSHASLQSCCPMTVSDKAMDSR
jgi:hypothetical protein